MTGRIRIGISGWNYAPWRGVFYPPELPHRCELSYAASRFSSIEVNGTFYSLKRPADFERWYDETPSGFVFSIKGSRYITHMLRLKDVHVAMANFCAQGLLRLGAKLGPVLWQFPEKQSFNVTRFSDFIDMLPRDTDQMRALARRHDGRVAGRAVLRPREHLLLRHAFEIRNESFCTPRFIDLLHANGMALVCADTVEWPLLMDLTADFVYCRLHGSEELYVSGYDKPALDIWGRRVRAWARGSDPPDSRRAASGRRPRALGRDVYVYFDNDAKVRAPQDALSLRRRCG
jgi:uncharacterized protein YecE (DUF72 family)